MRWEVFLFEFKKHTYEVSFKIIMYWKLIYLLVTLPIHIYQLVLLCDINFIIF